MSDVPVTGRHGGALIGGGLAAALVVATVLNALVATIARATGASPEFQPLQLPVYGTFPSPWWPSRPAGGSCPCPAADPEPLRR